jgi:hypothetical protein
MTTMTISTQFFDTVKAAIRLRPSESNGVFARRFSIRVDTVRRVRRQLVEDGLIAYGANQ